MGKQEEKKLASAEQAIIDEFIKDLELTADHVKELLIEIRNSKIDLATIKAEFRFVTENVKLLSVLIKDGENSSIMTRLAVVEVELNSLKRELKEYIAKDTDGGVSRITALAILEQKLSDISLYISSLKAKEDLKKKAQDASIAGKWQLYVAIAGGVFALLGSIVALLMSVWGK